MTGCMSEALPVQIDRIFLSERDVLLLMCEAERAVSVRRHIISATLSMAVHVPILEA